MSHKQCWLECGVGATPSIKEAMRINPLKAECGMDQREGRFEISRELVKYLPTFVLTRLEIFSIATICGGKEQRRCLRNKKSRSALETAKFKILPAHRQGIFEIGKNTYFAHHIARDCRNLHSI